MKPVQAYEDIEGALHHDEPSCAQRNVELALRLLNPYINKNQVLDPKALFESDKCFEVIEAMKIAGEYLPFAKKEVPIKAECPHDRNPGARECPNC